MPSRAVVAVFAADHGVVASGVTPWPQDVTTAMVENFRAGGAAVNVLAAQAGADVVVVDIGVASDVKEDAVVWARKVRPGTDDLAVGPAMSRQEARGRRGDRHPGRRGAGRAPGTTWWPPATWASATPPRPPA